MAPAGNIADGRRFDARVANLHQNKECPKLPAEKERPQVPTYTPTLFDGKTWLPPTLFDGKTWFTPTFFDGKTKTVLY